MSKIGICELNPNANCNYRRENITFIMGKYNTLEFRNVCNEPKKNCKDCKLIELKDETNENKN